MVNSVLTISGSNTVIFYDGQWSERYKISFLLWIAWKTWTLRHRLITRVRKRMSWLCWQFVYCLLFCLCLLPEVGIEQMPACLLQNVCKKKSKKAKKKTEWKTTLAAFCLSLCGKQFRSASSLSSSMPSLHEHYQVLYKKKRDLYTKIVPKSKNLGYENAPSGHTKKCILVR